MIWLYRKRIRALKLFLEIIRFNTIKYTEIGSEPVFLLEVSKERPIGVHTDIDTHKLGQTTLLVWHVIDIKNLMRHNRNIHFTKLMIYIL